MTNSKNRIKRDYAPTVELPQELVDAYVSQMVNSAAAQQSAALGLPGADNLAAIDGDGVVLEVRSLYRSMLPDQEVQFALFAV